MTSFNVSGTLTRDERAKLNALGGAAWIRLKLRDEPMPTCARSLHQVTDAERVRVLDHRIPANEIARDLGLAVDSVRAARFRARHAARA